MLANYHYKEYELKDHPGNVRVVFLDWQMRTSGSPLKFDLDLRAVNNYYPFGMLQPGRYWQSGDSRFVFYDMEKDIEVKGGLWIIF